MMAEEAAAWLKEIRPALAGHGIRVLDPKELDAILKRLDALTPATQRRWGKMDPAQMLTHCRLTVEAGTGDLVIERSLLARILGPLFRKAILGPKPFGRDAPTHPKFVIADARDFAKEKERLVAVLRKFAAAGPAGATREHGITHADRVLQVRYARDE